MTRRMLVAAAVTLGVSLLLGVIVAVAAGGRALQVTVPLGVVAFVGTLVLGTAIVVGVTWHASVTTAQHASRVEGEQAGRAHEHAAHRRFVDRLDHELKNPLTAIRAATAGLAPEGQQADNQADLVATIDGQSARIARLVSDLRKVGELETVAMEREPVDLSQVVAEVVEDVTTAASATGSPRRIDVTLPRAPWPLPIVRGDRDLLHLALVNVVGNACKFSPLDSVVEVRGSEHEGWVEIEVADTGIGVAAGELSSVFDELARGSRTRHLPGSGIGLSLVRVVAERHGGTVAIRSRENTGTAVVLRLPVA